ncbi:MAG TPA: prepilin-type N-terminal cleavage/methylation domain-containing protein [Candidatus Angelobacter sp.]|jgi:prepilin-type N-terminal cleavage/methylation domain-containing protein|nr:prepilin-type N-terminal cleavage/methylation domain-containing protein [Candidatus Angelobacter sp.]
MNTQRPISILHRRRRGEQGFTLIELLVVIAVLAILAAIVLFNVVGVANRGKSSACNTDIATVQTAVDGYISDHGDFAAPKTTTSILAALTGAAPPYLHTLTGSGQSKTNCQTTFSIAGDATNGYTVTGG